jgi:DNA mismatch repair protein MutS2
MNEQIKPSQSETHEAHSGEWDKQALLKDALERLEWQRLTDALAQLAMLQHTKGRLQDLSPWISESERTWNLRATSRLIHLLSVGEGVEIHPFDAGYFFDAISHGALLNGIGLYHLGLLCSQTERLGTKARNEQRKEGGGSLGPELAGLLSQLKQQTSLARRLALAADENGRILDSASAELKEARQKFDTLTRRMTHSLENTLKVPTVRDALQDAVWMLRDGRYVLPVRVDRKSDVPGVARGVSSSGNTLFIEPAGLSELQAQLSAAETDVMLAENRVLRAFSDEAYSLREELLSALEILETFDCVCARARLASRLGAVMPEFHENPQAARFELLDAQHPLYILEDKPCVPNHLLLQPSKDGSRCPRVWVLSGPNAGGKTVAMRTVGLQCAMALAGLFVPSRKATFFNFNSIYVEMGDRQDRREDLSTFSGHLLHVRRICELTDAHSLVLLDEGFVGTDPSIGSAMAQATLETLAERGATSIITTHFSSLKTLADKQPLVFANASMEFEPDRLKPTFHLLNGVPGQSFAIELARRLNYPEDLLQRALRYRGERELELENLLAELQKSRQELRFEISKNRDLNQQLVGEVDSLSRQRKALQHQQENLLNDYTTKLQKRFNAFENRLETRARQFERAQQQILSENKQRAESEAAARGDDDAQTPPAASSGTVISAAGRAQQAERPVASAVGKGEPDKRKPRSLSDFSQLANLRVDLPQKSASAEVDLDESWQKLRKPAKLSQRDLIDEARESLDVMRKSFEKTSDSFAKQRDELSEDMNVSRERGESVLSEAREKRGQIAKHPPEFWTVGRRVKTAQFDKVGEVVRTADNKGFVECSFGLIKTKIHFSDLMTIDEAAQKASAPLQKKTTAHSHVKGREKNKLDMSIDPVLPTRDNTIDVRGHLVDTALEHIERFIDKAWRDDVRTIVIVHGHGTGRVKSAVREFLQDCSYRLTFRPGSSGEGGDGATVVILD